MKRWLKVILILFSAILLVLLAVALWAYSLVSGSLPQLEGEVAIAGLSAPVTIERDQLGIPSIRGENKVDVARALGFVHGQDRFFQMDLTRRQAAGELAELIGPPVVESDLASRFHQFRKRARRVVDSLSGEQKDIVDAYVEGVNSGLASLDRKPFEYYLLQSDPRPWNAEDSILTLVAMFFVLNDETGIQESNRGVLHDLLPAELARFVAPEGTRWDAPIVGDAFVSDQIPGPEVFDLKTRIEDVEGHRAKSAKGLAVENKEAFASWRLCGSIQPWAVPGCEWSSQRGGTAAQFQDELQSLVGSNNWSVAGSRTKDGRAIVADDMHLGISVPNIWYRALLQWKNDGSAQDSTTTVVGVTLPGVPAVVAGSNTHVAWGFTNSTGDWSDLVVLEVNPDDPNQYLTPDGYETFQIETERIDVKGAEPQTLEIRHTIWGPVIDQDYLGRPRALRWIAHDPEAVNLNRIALYEATNIDEAVEIANRSGIPPQNFVVVDQSGRTAWTIEGRIPRRIGFDGQLPVSWADGSRKWDGYYPPEEYPRVIDPESGTLWTANSRVVNGEMLEKIGQGLYDLGARTQQIRDDLFAQGTFSEQDMLKIQLDNRALFLERWRDLILDLLDEEAFQGNDDRRVFRNLVENSWSERASVESVGYPLVRTFRVLTDQKVFGWLTASCKEADERFSPSGFRQREESLWLMVTKRPNHLLDPQYESWEQFLLSMVDETIAHCGGVSQLPKTTWGSLNTARIQHPLSRALPFLSSWLDMPADQLAGDGNMPCVLGPNWGASERFAVSPGREEDGYLHMPTGQSGHPLSPYYRSSHSAWVRGLPTPFLPGKPDKVLQLHP